MKEDIPKSVKVRKLNPGTPNTSNRRNCKSRTSTKISKYFTAIENTDKTLKSPYNDLLTSKDDVKPIDIDNDFDDFKSPKPIRVAQLFEISKQNNVSQDKKGKCKPAKLHLKKSKHRKKGLRADVTKLFAKSPDDDNCLNKEHLHMALALSKSEMQNADHDVLDNSNNLTPIVSSQEKSTKIRTTLEQFGFNILGKSETCQQRNIAPEINQRKKSRFKYITPVLCTRTEAERLEIISNKIALILNSNEIVRSEDIIAWQLSATSGLKNYYVGDARIFQMNSACLSNEEYYVPSLNVPHCDYVPGCLLKYWGNIIGRDKSPEKENNTFIKRDNNEKLNQLIENTITSETISGFVQSNNDIPELNKTLHSQINDENSSSTQNQNINSPIKLIESKPICAKYLQVLSPDLFSSEDEDLPHEPKKVDTNTIIKDSITNINMSEIDNPKKCQSTNEDFDDSVIYIKDRNASLTENDSVINITISQIEKLKPLSSVDTYFESMQLKKLKKILDCNNFETPDTIESPLCLSHSNAQYNMSYEYSNNDELASTNKEITQTDISNRDDKLVDLTNCSDSDCHIIEDLKEVVCASSKINLKRFSSFNSTTSIDSNTSCTSAVSISISDEELNYSTNNSAHCRKQRNRRITKNEITTESSYKNLSPFYNENANNFNESSNSLGISSKRADVSDSFKLINNSLIQDDNHDYINVLATLDNITAKYIKETQESKKKKNTSLLSDPTISENGLNIIKTQNRQKNTQCSTSNLMDLDESSALLNELKDDIQNSPNSAKNERFGNLTLIASESINTTPSDDHLIIRTENVTPIPNYTDMDTPKITGALRKFGLKPLKRKRGVQLLKYIYDVTHPEIPDRHSGESEDDLMNLAATKRKLDVINPLSLITSSSEGIEIVGDIIGGRESIKDLILEQKKSAKLSTCSVPLNIAWHNLLAANPCIRESMLMYEPLEIERLYAMLKAQGLKYNVQDVITFLDKKCITIRMKPNTAKKKL